MEMNIIHNSLLLLFIVLTFVLTFTNSHRDTAYYDDYMKKRAKDALEDSFKAYNPNPEELTDQFNGQVGEVLIHGNVTRRHLKEGDCKATNPIDRCWRCDPNWARNRKRLADCAQGFGRHTTGGRDGLYYVVNNPSDDDMQNPKPGTLRHAVIQDVPLWIIFKHSMVIRLQQELIFTSNKTIDGRGVEVHIAHGAGITLQFVKNIIIHNIKIHHIVAAPGGLIRDSADHFGLRARSDGDGISVFGASNIWIDHVSLSKCTDGLIDAIMASTAITISNCKFNNHDDVMLLGANDEHGRDVIMQTTVAFNRFGKGLIQRMPRCRWGFFHIVNNDYSQWQMYAIGGSSHPTIISQGNRFKASNHPFTKQVTKRQEAEESEWMKWQWRSEGDKFLNGAYFVESGSPIKHTITYPLNLKHKNMMKFRPGSYAGRLTRYAGAINCKVGELC
ncbi:pectate lyase-like [Olea europaea subsp. europaea]|uniref:Pectate lyase n=1 Tax=Olea europaea subsp. europaea TaxID=158383 RepID=A0A8S0S5F2_OLEEU|nr:pectate lyase-like [Olea europaea subsp. europaea]